MRYNRDNSGDWAEIAGVAERELCELDVLYYGSFEDQQALVSDVVKDCNFTNRKGEAVDPREHREAETNADGETTKPAYYGYRRLHYKQWKWLREKIIETAHDEILDPQP